MKICFLTSTPFMVGGIQRVVLALANQLAKKHDITIAYTYQPKEKKIYYPFNKKIKFEYCDSFHDGKGKYVIQKICRKVHENCIYINNEKLLKNIYYPRKMRLSLIRYINEKNFDIVIGCAGKYSLLLGIIAPEVKCRCIGWEHNSFDAYFTRKGHNSLWKQDLIFKKYIPNLRKCVVLSDSDVKSYKEKFGLTVYRIYNPVCLSSERKVNIFHNILFVGRLEYEQKGLHYLAQIINIFLKKNAEWIFTIVGDGAGKEHLISEIDECVINRVIFAGKQKYVEKYYKKSDILISTSTWEGFGLVVVEAMSFGLPVISFKTVGPSEIIQDNICGRLIDCFNVDMFVSALNETVYDKRRYLQMSDEAFKRSRLFSVEAIAEQWNNVLFD